mmetsp:Transcript_76974/g.213946  ORF Transcript_76974/g.213946 Transcript_76974/m.213946 type:complete len:420 (+) Transcript_76974:67-1326(+)
MAAGAIAQCWQPPYSEQLCCDRTFGPAGNAHCWDGVAFTFERCCPHAKPSTFDCVPTKSCALAAVSVLGAIGLAAAPVSTGRRSPAVSAPRGLALQSSDPAVPALRNLHFDNAKFLAMATVVWAHTAHFTAGPFTSPGSAVIKALRFQMPLFCILSGATSRRPLTEDRMYRIVTSLVVPIILYALLIAPSMHLFNNALGVPGLDPKASFAWTYSDVWGAVTMTGRIDLAWYLRCLLLWRLASPLLYVLPDRVQMAVVLSIGLASAYSHVSGWKVVQFQVPVRTASMFPFFYIGQRLDWEQLSRKAPRSCAQLLVGWAGLLCYVCAYVVFEPTLDQVTLALETYPTEFVSLRDLLEPDCHADALFLWARYVLAVALRSAMAVLVLLFCVPKGNSFLTIHADDGSVATALQRSTLTCSTLA